MPPVAAFAAAYAVSNTAAAIGLSIATQATLAAAAASIASTATYILILSGAALALQSTRENPNPGNTAGQQNLRQEIPPRMRYYGENLTGGYWAFWQAKLSSSEDSSIFYGALVTGHGESDSIVDRFINSRRVLDDVASGILGGTWRTPTSIDYKDSTAYILSTHYNNYLGTDDQLSDAAFNSSWSTAWDSDHRLRGLTIVYLVFISVETPESQSRRFPSGSLPTYTERRKCSKVFNPNSGLYEYSENSALVLGDFLAHADAWGLGHDTVDWDNISDEMAICATTQASKGEGTIPTYTSAGGYSLNDDRISTLADVLASCDAILIPRPDGKVGIKVGRWESPTITVSPRSVLRMQAKKFATGPGEINIVRPTYTDRRLQFKATEGKGYYESSTPAWGTSPTTEEIIQPLNVLWIPYHNQATRIAKRVLKVLRATWTINLVLDQYGLLLMGERFFVLNYPVYGMVDMTFEIQKYKILAGGLSVEVDAVSVDSSDWDFDYTTEEPDLPEIPADPDAA